MPGVENPLKGSMASSYVPVLSGVDLEEREKNRACEVGPFLTVVMVVKGEKSGLGAETSSVDDTFAWDHKRVRSHQATPQQRRS